MSLIEETPARQVRMANLAIVGTHSTNGVAQIHSRLLREKTVADFAHMFPDRFNNKTNGVTPRRWLLDGQSRPGRPAHRGGRRRAGSRIWTGWPLSASLARDTGFRDRFRQAKQAAKSRFAAWVKRDLNITLDESSIFDSQIKRIHEYKRQLLNVLHIAVLYHRLRTDPRLRPAAAHVLLRRQGRARLSPGQADHQADQRPGTGHR